MYCKERTQTAINKCDFFFFYFLAFKYSFKNYYLQPGQCGSMVEHESIHTQYQKNISPNFISITY